MEHFCDLVGLDIRLVVALPCHGVIMNRLLAGQSRFDLCVISSNSDNGCDRGLKLIVRYAAKSAEPA